MTLEEIKNLVSSGVIAPETADVVAAGTLKKSDDSNIPYNVHCGWDIVKALACDQEWGKFTVRILNFIEKKFPDAAERDGILEQTSLEDHHWEWFQKAALYRSEEYRWFFLMAEGLPQAACLIYQPKASALINGNIFYVEFIAVSTWNRKNPMQNRIFAGVGTRMLKHAVEHCRNTLNLMPGFSLHALPKAMSFYEKIGMLREENLDKGVLAYYEMPQDAYTAFAA